MDSIRESTCPSMGIKLLDRDHDHLKEILEEIQLMAAAGFASGQTGVMLRKLAKRMRLHFALEEQLMSATRYPGTVVHHLKHQWLVDQLDLLATQRGRSALEQNAHLLSLLADSHFKHMSNEDLDYGLWLSTKGVHHKGAACAGQTDL